MKQPFSNVPQTFLNLKIELVCTPKFTEDSESWDATHARFDHSCVQPKAFCLKAAKAALALAHIRSLIPASPIHAFRSNATSMLSYWERLNLSSMHQAPINAGPPKCVANAPRNLFQKTPTYHPWTHVLSHTVAPADCSRSHKHRWSHGFSPPRPREVKFRKVCNVPSNKKQQRSHETNTKTYPSSYRDCWGYRLGALKLPKFVGIGMEIPLIYQISRSLRHWITFKLMKKKEVAKTVLS